MTFTLNKVKCSVSAGQLRSTVHWLNRLGRIPNSVEAVTLLTLGEYLPGVSQCVLATQQSQSDRVCSNSLHNRC